MRLSATVLGAALLASSVGMAVAAGSDHATGLATKLQATPMSDAEVRQKLESEGYTNVRITEHSKSHIDVTASKDGKPIKLAVNPQSGQATSDTDKDKDD